MIYKNICIIILIILISGNRMQLYERIPKLKISPKGVFKYILIKAQIEGKQAAIFIRGDTKYEFHADNYKAFRDQLKSAGFTQIKKRQQKISSKLNGTQVKFTCVGGGRIQHNYNGTICSIYGYSKSFGYVDHKIAQNIISQEKDYPLESILLNEKQY